MPEASSRPRVELLASEHWLLVPKELLASGIDWLECIIASNAVGEQLLIRGTAWL
jgi:hypothetical protein